MTPRSRTALALAAAAPLLAALSACRERGRPDPEIRLAISHEREQGTEPALVAQSGTAAQPGKESGKASVPTRLEVPPAVREAYTGVRLSWKDASGGKSGTVDVPLGGTAPIPGSPLQVRADVYLPAFTMSADAITSTGTAEENPAARIAVLENGKELFAGWIFNRFPDVHPFQHPRFSLKLEGGIPKGSK